jgi:hypothetical protein
MLDNGTEIRKSELQALKNDDLPEEAWVKCESCNSWVHEICALFNRKMNGPDASFVCPNCFLAHGGESEDNTPEKNIFKRAADIPQCKIGHEIESGVLAALEKAYEAHSKDSSIETEHAPKVTKLRVRVLSSVEKEVSIGEEMAKLYGLKSFPVRTKCIALFQEIHDVDTLLFALYVSEYGDDCPSPNQRTVYISCMDSVKYFEPTTYRTLVYQQILVEYLKTAKDRGFRKAFIWSCPPTPGDDYIFYCHPQHQLTPREDMLRSWYHAMLSKASEAGIVTDISNIYDEYFNDDEANTPSHVLTPLGLPYFEGDYIPSEIESIIRQISPTSEPEEGLSKTDEVVRRIGQKLSKMKENFLVAHLNTTCPTEGIEISAAHGSKNDESASSARNESTVQTEPGSDAMNVEAVAMDTDDTDVATDNANKAEAEKEDTNTAATQKVATEAEQQREQKVGFPEIEKRRLDEMKKGAKEESVEGSGEEEALNETQGACTAETASEQKRKSHSTAEEKKVNNQHDVRNDPPVPLDVADDTAPIPEDKDAVVVGASKGGNNDGAAEGSSPDQTSESVLFVDDEDPSFGSELFESRQHFLSFCQSNHYQFDELRRAKHSTMMVLFQLHQPSGSIESTERNVRLRRLQQLMDDRRRQAQNELYHTGGGS